MKTTLVTTTALVYEDFPNGNPAVSMSEAVRVIEDLNTVSHMLEAALNGDGPPVLRLRRAEWNGATSEWRVGKSWVVTATHVIDLLEMEK